MTLCFLESKSLMGIHPGLMKLLGFEDSKDRKKKAELKQPGRLWDTPLV